MSDNIREIAFRVYQSPVDCQQDYAIIILDTEGHILNWSTGAEMLSGYTADEITGKNYSVFFTAEDRSAGLPEKNLQKAKAFDSLEEEGWRVRKDGTFFWARDGLTCLKDDSGTLVGIGQVIRNITVRKMTDDEIGFLKKKMQKQMQKSKTEIDDYKHALDESSIVAITDQKGIIKHVNDNFCRISKYTREELIGQDHRIINSAYHPKEFIRNLWVTIANGKIWRGELRNRAKDGSHYWVDTTIVPFLDNKGKPYQYLAIRSDITKRKQAEEQLLRMNEELEIKVAERTLELQEALEKEKELNEMKSRFVSTASHEFRTPLSAILSSVSLVEHYVANQQTEKRTKHIERIKSSVRNLTNILDYFLSLDKLEQGKVDINCVHFDLRKVIDDAIEEMDGMAKKKQQKIICVYKGVPEVCQDKKILRNILLNLLSNAVKYSHEGQQIDVLAEVNEQQVEITVKDRGIGIPPEAQKNLFTKFFRAGNAVNIQGTGLGLNIVKHYVGIIGGSISFTSSEKGTSFTIVFPPREF